ncbi:universal stress protein [Nitrosomonas sp. Nm132]|uniref:universal stress protein n=1 Tax=Nitrosomonas sp. Nm132 TaxID=1881053 RepID=UPI00087ECD1F|nr:universal stress protein [Nitrosomonas sp. Nm132]SDH78015.1 Nucleotide-binding universal stress protein, UspA family [Nitrosomonas sp. Nm132]
MIRIQSILAATDFSADAQYAAERAAIISAATGASQGVILHVLKSSWLDNLKHFANLPVEVEQSMVTNASRSLNQLIAKIQEQTGFAFEPRVFVGNVLDMILKASEDFDLLALGARGENPLRDFALGTTTEQLIRQSRKPMLVVRREAKTAYRCVLVAVDFSPHSLTAFAYGNVIAPQSEIYLTHIFEAPFEGKMRYAGVTDEIIQKYRIHARHEAEAEMKGFIETSGIDSRNVCRMIEHGRHVPAKLRDKVLEIGADLVVVGKHGKSLTEQLLLGSVTLHLLTECPCDVLVVQ